MNENNKAKVNKAVMALWEIRKIVSDAVFCSTDTEWINNPLREELLTIFYSIHGAFGFSELGEREMQLIEKETHEQD